MADHEITGPALAAGSQRAGVVLLDVREPWEHQLARCRELLVPLGELAQRAADVAVPSGALVVTYCHHGVRSLSAARWLAAAGWPHVVSLAGGIDAWSRSVDPLVPRY
jgi:adenylyltransferase/sulfurtransferase